MREGGAGAGHDSCVAGERGGASAFSTFMTGVCLDWSGGGNERERGISVTYLINTSTFPPAPSTRAISSATAGSESKSAISPFTTTTLGPSRGWSKGDVDGLRTTAMTKLCGSWESCFTHSSCLVDVRG